MVTCIFLSLFRSFSSFLTIFFFAISNYFSKYFTSAFFFFSYWWFLYYLMHFLVHFPVNEGLCFFMYWRVCPLPVLAFYSVFVVILTSKRCFACHLQGFFFILMGKDVKQWKRWLWLASGMWSTCSLVEIHNKCYLG